MIRCYSGQCRRKVTPETPLRHSQTQALSSIPPQAGFPNVFYSHDRSPSVILDLLSCLCSPLFISNTTFPRLVFQTTLFGNFTVGSCLLELSFYPAPTLQPLLECALQIFPVKGVRELGLSSEGSSTATDATVLQEGWP